MVVSPAQRAGLLLAVRDMMKELRLPVTTATEILMATGAKRGCAYEAKIRIKRETTPMLLARKRGRPKHVPAEPNVDGLPETLLSFLLRTPGAVTGGPVRQRYSADLRRFILKLQEAHPHLTRREFADAVTISQATIAGWEKSPDGPITSTYESRRVAHECRLRRVVELLHQQPAEFGINRTRWTQETLVAAYKQSYGMSICRTTVGNLIKESGYGWRRARRVLTSPDPDYREKVERLLLTLRSLAPTEMFFFVDELGPVRVKRYGGRCYVPKGSKRTVPQQQSYRGVVTLYGALSATTNQMAWAYGTSKDTRAMVDLIEILFNRHQASSRVFVTWDAAAWHSSTELLAWLDGFNVTTRREGAGPVIELVPLPSSAQFLDVIEAVFSGMKQAVIHNSDYPAAKEMKTAISRHFRERNEFFFKNPRRAGKKIWEVDFFQDHERILSGNYREY